MEQEYLTSVIRLFNYYKKLGEDTFAQLSDEQLFASPAKESNSIAVIVQHLHGNMLSRWTDFLSSDGEKEWRKRDEEFEAHLSNRSDLMNNWEEGWQCLFKALEGLSPADLAQTVYIRNQGQLAIDAINRQVAHYSYHVGQIVYAGKLQVGDKWHSLSIPKNASRKFNENKFSKPKNSEHFTSEFVHKKYNGK
jgi:hypothetical protein